MSKWIDLKAGDVVPKGAQVRWKHGRSEWRDSIIDGRIISETRALFFEYRAPVVSPLPMPTCAGWWWRRSKSYAEAPWVAEHVDDHNGVMCQYDNEMDEYYSIRSGDEWIGPITPPDL